MTGDAGAALEWALRSGIAREGSGAHAYYLPGSGYGDWGGGATTTLAGAGILRALAEAGDPADGRGLYTHLRGLVAQGPKPLAGAMPAGAGSCFYIPDYVLASADAFHSIYVATDDPEALDLALRSAGWVARRVVAEGGLPPHAYRWDGRSLAPVGPRPVWILRYVPLFRQLAAESPAPLFDHAAARLIEQARGMVGDTGWVPFALGHTGEDGMESLPPRPGTASGGPADLRGHPECFAAVMEALDVAGDTKLCDRVARAVPRLLREDGVCRQFTYEDGKGSPEGDVMPTVHLRSVFKRQGRALWPCRVADAQVSSGPKEVRGGVRGLPGHPRLDRAVHAWDTAWFVLGCGAGVV